MQINLRISKWANFYYFLHNFAECEWPWPSRPAGPISIWRGKFGNFNQEEKVAIRNFKRVYRRYFLKYYLGKPFFEEENPWSKIERKISKADARTLKAAFSVFEEKLDIIYRTHTRFLRQWEKRISKTFGQSRNEKIERILDSLFGLNLSCHPFNLYLLLGRNSATDLTTKYAGGAGGERGRGLTKRNILLEFDVKCPQKKINYIAGVLWHEITHYCVENSKAYELLKQEIKNQRGVNYAEEIIIRSLFPIGILSVKFLDAPPPTTLTPFTKSTIPPVNAANTTKLLNLIERYAREGKKIDKDYIKKFVAILSKTKKWATLLK